MEEKDKFKTKVVESLPFELTGEQRIVLDALSSFVMQRAPRDVFVLNGYAGTGKTSLVGGVIKVLDAMKRRVVILAPTGRGAKVASSMSDHAASTIHRRLFRPDPSDPEGRRYLPAPNESRDTLFVVDEASLIPDSSSDNRSLLAQLVHYVYSAPGCAMLLMGDEAQLPPVGQSESTAMCPDRLRSLGLNPICTVLEVPVRQNADSGIIFNATVMRHRLLHPEMPGLPTIQAAGFPDIHIVDSRELPDAISDSYSSVGKEETLVITRSNWRANDFNMAIRNMVLYAEEPLERGDRLVITKNDYYWSKINKAGTLIANGDMAEVTWTGATEKAYGRYFTEVELLMADGRTISAQLMLRSLVAKGASIPRQEMEAFYNRVMSQAEGELSEKIKTALDSPYYNALQAKYAYCVTCHKAQGGQWKHVYIDMGGIAAEDMAEDFYRWIYTAITRATERLYFINPTIPVQ